MELTTDHLIVGAGIGGLASADWLSKNCKGDKIMVTDSSLDLPLNLHNGVHYLHSVPELPMDIDFKEIVLTDGVLINGSIEHQPKLQDALMYSEKVREEQHPSSIMEVGKRNSVYMSRGNSLNELIKQMNQYAQLNNVSFEYGLWLESIDKNNKIATFKRNGETVKCKYKNLILTIPLNQTMKMLFNEDLELKSASLYIYNFKVERIVPNWMINIYIPEPLTPVYRASLLNGIISLESVKPCEEWELRSALNLLSRFFHIDTSSKKEYNWKTGKVISISIDERDSVVERLREQSVYTIGRFGLWNRKLIIDSTIRQAKLISELLAGTSEWSSIKKNIIS